MNTKKQLQAFGRDLRQLFEDFDTINPASLSDALGASPTAAADTADQQVDTEITTSDWGSFIIYAQRRSLHLHLFWSVSVSCGQ